jgi:hypothetical protein
MIPYPSSSGSLVPGKELNSLESFVLGLLAFGVLRLNKKYDAILKKNEDQEK